jgi:hypothetical protein
MEQRLFKLFEGKSFDVGTATLAKEAGGFKVGTKVSYIISGDKVKVLGVG